MCIQPMFVFMEVFICDDYENWLINWRHIDIHLEYRITLEKYQRFFS